MTSRSRNLSVGLPLFFLLSMPAAWAQQTSTDELKKEIEALSQIVKAMQKDLQDIKAMLQRRTPAAPPQNVELDVGSSRSRGQKTAKLTLVEFSDYQ